MVAEADRIDSVAGTATPTFLGAPISPAGSEDVTND